MFDESKVRNRGCLKSPPSLGILSDNFCHLRNSHSVGLPFETASLEDQNGKILSFLNIIPNYAPKEATYDLIRKIHTAPAGNMYVLLLCFIEYCWEEGYEMLNMGLAPLSGFDSKKGVIGTTIHFLYSKNKYFRNTRGLREFKEKYDQLWMQKYMV
ncbi:phosphatidylglycerol lysyltransferase domain-containing protein [Chryseobacterium sp. ON_d1]|nr:phosphatidylglycerol lysyltransferase domain-containing protein [Chryseobacterium sp. ON_d1]